ncbi:spore coat protein CotJB [Clostridium sp. 19966]|nr:spore coat protein CotJB [Clostridium sp. 19966]
MYKLDEGKRKLLSQIRELHFMSVDLNLYLDNFPTCEKAAAKYNETVKELDMLRKKYEDNYGPFVNFGYFSSKLPWQWVDEPWPWQICE